MADETGFQVLNKAERNPETDSWMWLFRSGEDGLPPILLYHYTETRAKFRTAYLPEWVPWISGTAETGVITICRISNAALTLRHVRRYFTDAIPKGKEYDYSLPAVQGVQFCSKLFDCERYSKAKNHTAEQRKQFRLEKEKPILEAFSEFARINSVETREPVGESGELCPKSERHPDDLSGRRSLPFIQ